MDRVGPRLARAHPLVRWAAALAWAGLLVALMLLPADAVRALYPFRGSELTDAAGHVVLLGVLVALWWWALVVRLASWRALAVAGGIGLALGVVTEVGQLLLPARGASPLDLAANLLGVGLAVLLIGRRAGVLRDLQEDVIAEE